MDLLPRSHSEFHSPEYWDEFFKKRGTKAFEWYGEYPELCGILHKYIKPIEKVLVVGCGNSQLSENLYDVGYHNITNMDISDIVIKQMSDKNKDKRPDMSFIKMDVMKMEFEDGEFGVVLDKGTLDALMTDDSKGVVKDIDKMFGEICRVLKQGGRYICISLLQEHIMNKMLQYFPDVGWPLRLHKVNTENSENTDKEFHMPVFALVATKFKKIPGMNPILEVSSNEDKVERFTTTEDVRKVLKEIQYYALIRQQISRRNVSGEQVSLSLYSQDIKEPRFTLYIVDSPNKTKNKFAIFIVPQGRETEWLFATDAGRQQITSSAGFDRVVIVTLNRKHQYQDLDSIKAELSTKVMELAPPGFKTGTQVPFLSVGVDIGSRIVQCEGCSDLSGQYVIEDVETDRGETYRRLIFLTNQNIVQSEARLKQVSKGAKKKGKKKKQMEIDKGYLCCQHHVAMVTGFAFVDGFIFIDSPDSDIDVLIVGLGGGSLATFIHQNFPQTRINVVDIDPAMVTIATSWFDFKEDERLETHIADGLDFIKKEFESDKKRHVIMLDVDSKDTSLGMSCPPQPFVEEEFLKQIKHLLLPNGVFVLNLVCRDEDLKSAVLQTLANIFPIVYVKNIEDEVNDIVYALAESSAEKELKGDNKMVESDRTDNSVSDKLLKPNPMGDNSLPVKVKESVKELEKLVKKANQHTEVELVDMLNDLIIFNR